MPLPIRTIRENEDKRDYNGLVMDYSFLATFQEESNKKIVVASNHEADAIVDIWTKGEKVSDNSYNIAKSEIDKNDIMKLKSRGLISGTGDVVSFTNKGKTIITTMALGENNAFLKSQNKKSYKEILANMSKKDKPGYRIPKFAADNSNNIDLNDGNEKK